jgi:hypothetical protein
LPVGAAPLAWHVSSLQKSSVHWMTSKTPFLARLTKIPRIFHGAWHVFSLQLFQNRGILCDGSISVLLTKLLPGMKIMNKMNVSNDIRVDSVNFSFESHKNDTERVIHDKTTRCSESTQQQTRAVVTQSNIEVNGIFEFTNAKNLVKFT